MRLETIIYEQPVGNYGFSGGRDHVTYLVDGDRWAKLEGYTYKDILILKESLEVK
tara:strand:+ start:157 stop:321 length:165 start_codon:yes stop_codon:yes gene_type:complete